MKGRVVDGGVGGPGGEGRGEGDRASQTLHTNKSCISLLSLLKKTATHVVSLTQQRGKY